MSEYYDRQGKPISQDQWAKQFEGDRVVRQTTLDPDIRVSTVWLGLDHSFGNGPPLIFETMIFGGRYDQDQWRYTTEAAAIEGHRLAVELAKKNLPQPQDEQFEFSELENSGLRLMGDAGREYEIVWVDANNRRLWARPV